MPSLGDFQLNPAGIKSVSFVVFAVVASLNAVDTIVDEDVELSAKMRNLAVQVPLDVLFAFMIAHFASHGNKWAAWTSLAMFLFVPAFL